MRHRNLVRVKRFGATNIVSVRPTDRATSLWIFPIECLCHGVMSSTSNIHQNRIFTYQVLTGFEGNVGFGKLPGELRGSEGDRQGAW